MARYTERRSKHEKPAERKERSPPEQTRARRDEAAIFVSPCLQNRKKVRNSKAGARDIAASIFSGPKRNVHCPILIEGTHRTLRPEVASVCLAPRAFSTMTVRLLASSPPR